MAGRELHLLPCFSLMISQWMTLDEEICWMSEDEELLLSKTGGVCSSIERHN